jgi:predicted nucleic acid-binding protein
MVIIDAGPLVALFDRSEPLHRTCRDVLSKLRPPLITSWPALTEAFYFLKGWKSGQSELWDFILSGGVQVEDIPEERYSRMRELMEKYADRPMDLADASVVVISEMHKAKTIFTLDRHDFTIYRPKHTPHFQIIP